ncbi:MAG TPA: AAA family ATPase [Polyangiaceae bacterium]|jgi:SpoVK/Ycf46/Vps4 family AAA+-type ATPase|nr:AAA family ATPase [Polyangiaceae bacterium]
MPDDDPVLLALRAALSKSESPELRRAAAERLLSLSRPAEALTEAETALRRAPSDAGLLQLAARAAEASGDGARSIAYRLAAEAQSSGDATSNARPPDADTARVGPEDTPASVRGGAVGTGLRLVASNGELREPVDEAPTLTFANVGGMDAVKQRLTRTFLSPLRNPELYKKFGKSIGGGLVLYGPPGCGKTFLARALAGEVGARFTNVSLSDVLDMWLGQSEKKLHEIFENARRQKPCVVFFDEVDALGQRRSALKGSAGRNVVNQLLAELDGYADRNDGVFVLGATNHPWDLDPALRRPGRFDRLVFVPPPDAEGRKRILELKLAGRPVATELDLSRFVKRTDGFSGADLEALVGLAAELAVEASVAENREVPIGAKVLEEALAELRPSARPWLEVARNHAIYANEGGTYDDLLEHLRAVGLA